MKRYGIGTILVVVALAIFVAGGVIFMAAMASDGNFEVDTPTQSITAGIEGEVSQPGVYGLPVGGTVGDLVKAAGGFTAKAQIEPQNLHRAVVDGETFVVAMRCLNINLADATEFATLPGIGPTRAEAIVGYRNANGAFQSVEQLQEVAGIGLATIANIQAADCIAAN